VHQRTVFISRLAILLALTMIVQMIGLPQPVTGPLVNLILILSVLLLNIKAAIVIGGITPLLALWRGQLPALLAPMIPFIVLGNILFVFVFGGCRILLRRFRLNAWIVDLIALVAGAGVKFLLLWSGAVWFVPLIFGKAFSPQFIFMMSTPQYLTALIGGGLALISFQLFTRVGIKR